MKQDVCTLKHLSLISSSKPIQLMTWRFGLKKPEVHLSSDLSEIKRPLTSFPFLVPWKKEVEENLPSSVSTNSANAICCAHRWSNCNYIQSRVQPLGKISESIFQQRHCKRCERSQVVRQPRSDSRMDERDCRWHRGLWNPMIQRLEAVERCGKDFSST